MGFSIREFLNEAGNRAAGFADFESACAREIAGLNENPSSGIWEQSLYTAMTSAGVPRDVISKLHDDWGPRFQRFRQLSETGTVRTPALRLFRICTESVAQRFNLSVNRVLSNDWIEFAVGPHDRSRLDSLLARMQKLRVEERWAAELSVTWEFLFEPGGQDDANLKPPAVYYELIDNENRHVKFVHPWQEDLYLHGIREYRRAEIETALSLVTDNRLSMVLGHPGWRPTARGFDLWLETLKLKLSSSGIPTADFITEGQDQNFKGEALKDFEGVAIMSPDTLASQAQFIGRRARVLLMADTGHSPHDDAGRRIAASLKGAGLRGEIAVLAVDHKILNDRQAEQIIFGESGFMAKDLPNRPDVIKDLARNHPMLPGTFSRLADALDEEEEMCGRKGAKIRLDEEARRTRRLQPKMHASQSGAITTPGGCWSGQIDRLLTLSKTNIVTVGQCAAPFFTMNLAIKA